MSAGSPTAPSSGAVLTALLISGAGHVIHNVAEFPLAILLGWETLFPLGVTVLIGIALLRRPGRTASAVGGAWALIVLVFGGGSVLPLGFLPFVPEQSVSHYVAHLVYAMTQLPLLWVAVRAVIAGSQPADQSIGG